MAICIKSVDTATSKSLREYTLAYRPNLSIAEIKKHLQSLYKWAPEHVYHGDNELFDSDFLEERHIFAGATLQDHPMQEGAGHGPPAAIRLYYRCICSEPVPLEVSGSMALEDLADLIGEQEKMHQKGLMCMLFSATSLLFRGNVGVTTKTPLAALPIADGAVLYAHAIPSDLRQDFFGHSMGHRIFDESKFWQPCDKQTPLALTVYLAALNSVHVELRKATYPLEAFLDQVQPPAAPADAEPSTILMTPVRKMTWSVKTFVQESTPDVAKAMAAAPREQRLQDAHLEEFPLCEPLLDGTFKPALHGEYGSHADVEPMHMMLSFKFKPRVVMHVARAVKLFREAGVAHRERPQTGSLTVTAKHKRPGLCWGLDEGVGGPKGAAVEAARPCVSPRDGAAVESSAALGWKAGLALATGRGKMLERS